jgi:hypothetical protein
LPEGAPPIVRDTVDAARESNPAGSVSALPLLGLDIAIFRLLASMTGRIWYLGMVDDHENQDH